MTTLTNSQTKALQILPRWYHGSNKIALLQGGAGTGKTYIVKYFLESLPNIKPLVLAPYNEAVKQLEINLGQAYTLKTVCSALNFCMTAKEDQLVLEQVKEPDLSSYNLLIVDECSTLSAELLSIIEQLDIYVLFIGHKSQLPPIVDVSTYDKCIPPVFTKDYLTIDLVENVRSTGEIHGFCTIAEELIYSVGVLPNKFKVNTNFVNQFLASQEGIETIFNGSSKFLAYTNKKVNYYNELSRNALFGTHAADSAFLVNDQVILFEPTFGFVNKLSGKDRTIDYILNKKKNENTLFTTNTKGVVNSVSTKTIMGVDCYELTIKTNHYSSNSVATFYTPILFNDFTKLKYKYHRDATYERDTSKRSIKWMNYSRLNMLFANIKHSYAMTVHKSQGSSIKNVIVCDNDIDLCHNNNLKKRLRYVAYSRTQENLYRLS